MDELQAGTQAAVTLRAILGPIGDDIAEVLRLRTTGIWRFRNTLQLAERAHQELATRGLTVEQLNPEMRRIVPLFESASTEDDPTLQAMWAELLANYLDPSIPPLSVDFHKLLSQLSPLEARILQTLGRLVPAGKTVQGITLEQLATEQGLTADFMPLRVGLAHLDGFGLLAGETDVDDYRQHFVTFNTKYRDFHLSTLGRALFNACAESMSRTEPI